MYRNRQHRSYRKIWFYLRHHPTSRDLIIKWYEMIEAIRVDDDIRNVVLADVIYVNCYNIAVDRKCNKIPVLRNRIIATLQRYELLIHGEVSTVSPIVNISSSNASKLQQLVDALPYMDDDDIQHQVNAVDTQMKAL